MGPEPSSVAHLVAQEEDAPEAEEPARIWGKANHPVLHTDQTTTHDLTALSKSQQSALSSAQQLCWRAGLRCKLTGSSMSAMVRRGLTVMLHAHSCQ